jgi:hypothetical protein
MSDNKADKILIGYGAGKRMDEAKSVIELKDEGKDRGPRKFAKTTSGHHHGT